MVGSKRELANNYLDAAAAAKKNHWPAIFNVSCIWAQIPASQYVAQWGQLSPREKTGGKRGDNRGEVLAPNAFKSVGQIEPR
jgi:hypothetical protein